MQGWTPKSFLWSNKNTDWTAKSVIFARPNRIKISPKRVCPLRKNSVSMAQTGKSSIKRGKPSYFMSVLGVTLVLFFLGIIGWLVINANKLGDYFKENVEVRAYLRGDLNPKDSIALMNYIASKPYVKSIRYVSKDEAKKIYMQDESEDWSKVLSENPL